MAAVPGDDFPGTGIFMAARSMARADVDLIMALVGRHQALAAPEGLVDNIPSVSD